MHITSHKSKLKHFLNIHTTLDVFTAYFLIDNFFGQQTLSHIKLFFYDVTNDETTV